ncbi:cellulose binding domain-containing protein [Dactylosporangium vinaceum]|nr:cellulose binding domain-containing protein [Dactylosporangium vinaceum]
MGTPESGGAEPSARSDTRRRVPRRRRSVAEVIAVLLLVAVGGWWVGARTAGPAYALGNGLALTPPMGWNDWNSYGCSVSDSLIRQTADKFVSSGLAAAGYQYVNIDDCWMQHSRDSSGNLQPDFAKFPSGISGVAAYVHSKGLKLGIYEDAGTATCAGYPGSLGHEAQDARLFASWGVDYLKYDNCNNAGQTSQQQYIARYTAMRDALAATGRPIVFSICEWGSSSPWTWGANVGNLWRTTGDISASFSSMLSIYRRNVTLAQYAGPGAWNDPDMLEVGRGMSTEEDRTEFSLWAEMAAPLLAGNNLVTASATTLSILGNKAVIAVDQDPLGKQGREVSSSGGLHVLTKPLSNGDASVVLFNENSGAATISTTAAAVGKTGSATYTLNDLWTGAVSSTTGTISASVPGHGVVMYRISGGSSSPSPSPSGSASPSPSPSSSGSGVPVACRVSDVISKWDTGLTANITITNSGSATLSGWSLVFTLPGGQTISNGWNATYSPSSGQVTATNVSYNGTLPPGGSTTIGFQATHTGNAAAPTAFALNGAPCAVS